MNYNIRLAEEKDKKEVLRILNEVFFDQQRAKYSRDEKYWNWKFIQSPFGRSLLTVAEDNDKIIAVSNLWPWEFTYHGAKLKTLQACDSAVHKEYRGHGLFKLMRIHGIKLAINNNFDFIFNFPNQMSINAYRNLGWQYIGKIPWWVRLLKPSRIINVGKSTKQSIPVSVKEKFSINTDRLNSLGENDIKLDNNIKTNRVDNFHEWRYVNHPYRSYGMIESTTGGKAAIFTLNQKGANIEMVVVDIIGSCGNSNKLFEEIVEVGKEMEVSLIAVMGNERYDTGKLWKLKFVPRRLKNMTVLPLNICTDSIVTKYSNWSLVAGMHDSI